MSNKITKIAMIEAIEQHLLERNQRLTNLKKISYERLEQRVIEFNIDMNKFIKERNEKLNKEKEERKQEKIKQKEIIKEYEFQKLLVSKDIGLLKYHIDVIRNKYTCMKQIRYDNKDTDANKYISLSKCLNFEEVFIIWSKRGLLEHIVKNLTLYKENYYKRMENLRIQQRIKNEEIKEEVEEVKEEKPSTKNDKFLCSCGSYCRKDNKARHIKTVKHQEYLKSL